MRSRRQERALQHYLDQLLHEQKNAIVAVTDVAPVLPKIIGSSIAKLLDDIEQRTETPVLISPALSTPVVVAEKVELPLTVSHSLPTVEQVVVEPIVQRPEQELGFGPGDPARLARLA
jgi:hypothetical protein